MASFSKDLSPKPCGNSAEWAQVAIFKYRKSAWSDHETYKNITYHHIEHPLKHEKNTGRKMQSDAISVSQTVTSSDKFWPLKLPVPPRLIPATANVALVRELGDLAGQLNSGHLYRYFMIMLRLFHEYFMIVHHYFMIFLCVCSSVETILNSLSSLKNHSSLISVGLKISKLQIWERKLSEASFPRSSSWPPLSYDVAANDHKRSNKKTQKNKENTGIHKCTNTNAHPHSNIYIYTWIFT